jgi:vitamin B12 transporter
MFCRLIIGIFAALAGTGLCMPLYAQAADDDVEVIEITGDNHYQSPNYQILLREQFVNSSQTLSDLLKSINGIQIRQISGLGNPTSVSIRGSTSKQVKLYIDGQLVNDSQFGGFDLNQIPTEQIQSIEVSKNQALGSGSTPIGGVIRINTYNPKENTLRLSAGLGSFGYGEFNLIKNHVFEHNNLSFGATRLQSDNDYRYFVPQTFKNSSVSANQDLRNNAFDKNAFFINNEAQWGQHQLRLNIQYSSQSKEIANYQNNNPLNHSQLDTDTTRYGYQHNWQTAIPWMEQLEFEFYHQDKDEDYQNRPGGSINTSGDYDSQKQSVAIKPYFNVATLQITPFVDYSRQEFDSFSTTNGQPNQCNGISACDVSAEQKQLSWGSRIEWQPEHYAISSYVLFSQLQEKNSNVPLNHISDTRVFRSDEDYDTQELGVNYKHHYFNAFATYSNGVRTPTLFELFGDRGSFKGNDDLAPEKAKTLSVGADHKGEHYSLSSSVYRQHLNNSIVAIFNASGIGTYSNVSDASLTGFELQGDYQFSPNLSLVVQANVINSSTDSDFVAFNNKKLPGIYHQQYSAGFDYQFHPHWKINLKANVDRQLYFNRANRFASSTNVGNGNPANRVTTDLTLNWHKGSLNASLAVKNLFDEDYQDLANRQAQGSSIVLKFSIEDL